MVLSSSERTHFDSSVVISVGMANRLYPNPGPGSHLPGSGGWPTDASLAGILTGHAPGGLGSAGGIPVDRNRAGAAQYRVAAALRGQVRRAAGRGDADADSRR